MKTENNITKIHLGFHCFPIITYGSFELTLKNPLSAEVAKERALKCKFTNEDFVEDLQEEMKKHISYSCSYAFFLDKYSAEEWGFSELGI